MSADPVYQLRLSSYPEFQTKFNEVHQAANAWLSSLSRDEIRVGDKKFKVNQRMTILAGMLCLRTSTKDEIVQWLEHLTVDKDPNKPVYAGTLYKAAEMTMNETALAKALVGKLAYEYQLHTVTFREAFHLGVFALAECDQDEIAALYRAANMIVWDLTS